MNNKDTEEMKHIQHQALLARVSMVFDRLESHNKEKDKQNKSQLFYIQGFAVIGYKLDKTTQKLRGILGHLVGKPEATMEELKSVISQLNHDIAAYEVSSNDPMPETAKEEDKTWT